MSQPQAARMPVELRAQAACLPACRLSDPGHAKGPPAPVEPYAMPARPTCSLPRPRARAGRHVGPVAIRLLAAPHGRVQAARLQQPGVAAKLRHLPSRQQARQSARAGAGDPGGSCTSPPACTTLRPSGPQAAHNPQDISSIRLLLPPPPPGCAHAHPARSSAPHPLSPAPLLTRPLSSTRM